MGDGGVVVLGIPIPSSSPVFLGTVAVHVAAGLVSTVAGIVAMVAAKRAGLHPAAGAVYYWSLVVVSVTMAALSIMRWPENTHLFLLGIVAFSAGSVGRMARRRRWRGWLPMHVTSMGVSYIVLLTAFYVDNGPNLALWRDLPRVAHWTLPTIVGAPIVFWTLARHPLLRRARSPR